MQVSTHLILLLLWLHFLADFPLQIDRMALQKSKSNKWLLIHVAVYGLPFLFLGLKFTLVNVVAHFVTDYITSRCTSHLAKRDNKRYFFYVVGFDQAVHMSTLVLTLPLAHPLISGLL